MYGENRSRLLDSVYLHPGNNILRFDRVCDLDWSAMLEAESLIFVFENAQPFSLRTGAVGYTA